MSGLAILAIVPTHSLDPSWVPSDARLITSNAFAAVVTSLPDEGFFEKSRTQLAPWLLAGQRIVEQMLTFTPVLPVTFGTVVNDDEAVHCILIAGQYLFEQALVTLGNRIEFDLIVRWDVQQAVREALTDSKLAEQLSTSRPEEERRAAGDELMRRIEVHRDSVSCLILEKLGPLVTKAITIPATEPEVVVSVALLLDPSSVEAVENALEAIDATFSEKITLNFRIVGPLAPYSFASIDINLPKPNEIESARAVLKVKEAATTEEIKAAYYQIVRQVHPDVVGAAVGNQTTLMTGLTEAYQILCASHMPVTLRHHQAT